MVFLHKYFTVKVRRIILSEHTLFSIHEKTKPPRDYITYIIKYIISSKVVINSENSCSFCKRESSSYLFPHQRLKCFLVPWLCKSQKSQGDGMTFAVKTLTFSLLFFHSNLRVSKLHLCFYSFRVILCYSDREKNSHSNSTNLAGWKEEG